MQPRSVVLMSGGLDSATALGVALRSEGIRKGTVHPFHVIYGQRHSRETESARLIADHYDLALSVATVSMPIAGSALTDSRVSVPVDGLPRDGIPVTYVPGRNTFLLGLAASFAESVGADKIWVGFNAIDYSGYPDCRPEFVGAMNATLCVGMKTPASVCAPIINHTKAAIVALAYSMGVPIQHTWSCYVGGNRPCNVCDSCRIRAVAFDQCGLVDPANATA